MAQVTEDSLASQLKEHMLEQVGQETAALKLKIEQLQRENTQNSAATNILQRFIQKGECCVDERGDVQVVTNSQPTFIKNNEESEDIF